MKTLKHFAFAGLAVVGAAFAVAAPAQDSSYKAGEYQDVSAIEIMPGQFENYMDYLATNWKKQQEFAKSKGWITGYSVLVNNYRRDGEPALYLVTRYTKQYSVAEQEAQDKEFEAYMKQSNRQMTTASGERAVMRKQRGTMQLQEAILK